MESNFGFFLRTPMRQDMARHAMLPVPRWAVRGQARSRSLPCNAKVGFHLLKFSHVGLKRNSSLQDFLSGDLNQIEVGFVPFMGFHIKATKRPHGTNLSLGVADVLKFHHTHMRIGPQEAKVFCFCLILPNTLLEKALFPFGKVVRCFVVLFCA